MDYLIVWCYHFFMVCFLAGRGKSRRAHKSPAAALFVLLCSAGLLGFGDAPRVPEWKLAQLSECRGGYAIRPQLSDDALSVVFISNCDLAGHNPDKNAELFRYHLGEISQLTFTRMCDVLEVSMDGSGKKMAFVSNCDFHGTNKDKNQEIFLLEHGAPIRQITDTLAFRNDSVALDPEGNYLAFRSEADFSGENMDHGSDIFLADLRGPAPEITPLSRGNTLNECRKPSLAAGVVAFQCDMNPGGKNPDGNMEIFVAALGSEPVQLTESAGCLNQNPQVSRAGNAVLFQSSCDLTGDNSRHYHELFLAQGMTIKQVTSGLGEGCWEPRLNATGGFAVFTSRHSVLGANTDHSIEVFIIDLNEESPRPRPIYELTMGAAMSPAIDQEGTSVVFCATANPLGANDDGGQEIFMATSRLDRSEPEPLTVRPGASTANPE